MLKSIIVGGSLAIFTFVSFVGPSSKKPNADVTVLSAIVGF